MSAIIFDHVSKRFVLQHHKSRTFQDLVTRTLHLRKNGNGSHEDFWALRDVSFEVPQGQMIGLIGPNGAGKSTALKLITRILQPTTGRIQVNGRVNALIELSASFHHELTGRENIYLSGALLGLSRSEIARHFDEIVAFSEQEKFIDTQVKHYSSGMLVRLGFAIASCIESEILLMDEVFAVGDASFKRKSQERIGEIRQRGTTIFMVSHQLEQIERNCDRVMLILNGQIEADGEPEAIIQRYENGTARALKKNRAANMYSADYVECNLPEEVRVGERLPFAVTVRNTSQFVWPGLSNTVPFVVSLGYRWYGWVGDPLRFPTPRIPMPQDIAPGECVTLHGFAIPPPEPGPYDIEFDLMVEGRGWFSGNGCLGTRVKMQVLPG